MKVLKKQGTDMSIQEAKMILGRLDKAEREQYSLSFDVSMRGLPPTRLVLLRTIFLCNLGMSQFPPILVEVGNKMAKEIIDRHAHLAEKLITKLDEVEFSAIMQMMQCMAVGIPSKMAFAACNEILVSNGREPVSYPLKISPALSSANGQKEGAR